jgi:hypothetical protein
VTLPLENSFEGGTNTTAMSGANSGGASGDPFDGVIGTAPTFSTTHAMHGSFGMAPATAAQSMVAWIASVGTPTEIWARCYIYFSGTSSVNLPFIVSRDQTNATNVCGIRVSTAMIPGITANAFTGTTPFTSTVPLSTWVRFEIHCLISAGNASTDGSYFATADAVTATETKSTASIATTATSFGAVRFGTNLAQTQAVWLDDVKVSGDGYPGPATLPRQRAPIWTPATVRAATY